MAKRVIFHQTGDPTAVLDIEDFSTPAPGPGQVLVGMRMAPVNPADLNLIEGKYGVKAKLPSPAGLEGAGLVEAVGEGVTGFAEGDQVLAPDGPCSWCTHILAEAASLVRVPQKLDARQAAMLRVNPSTAWRMLHDYEPLASRDWVAQNAGNSSVGRHVIQIARKMGWRTLSLVRRPELAAELTAIGADAVLVDDDDAPAKAREIFGGAHPRLALNAVGGDSVLRLSKMTAHGGSIITYGGMSRKPVTVPTGFLIFNDLVYRGFWLTRWWAAASMAAKQEMIDHLGSMALKGELDAPVDAVFPIDDIQKAVARAAEPGRNGKVLLNLAG